jgi:acyl-CoA synthetase (AMP-forming)/AMP-acid ligase II
MSANEVPSTIPELLRHVVSTRADHEAIVMVDGKVTYAELERRSARMARALLAIGAGKGARIALMSPDGISYLTTFLAATRIGALISLVSTLCKPPELAHILKNSDCQIFIGARRFLRHEYSETLKGALPGVEKGKNEKHRLTAAPYLRSIWLDDAEGLDWAGSVDELLERADAADAPDDALLTAIENEVVPSDDAFIMFTSGSTSLPKAVVHRQRTLVRKPIVLSDYFLLTAEDRMMPLLPTFWIGGLTMAIMILSKGGTLVYPKAPSNDVVIPTMLELKANKVNAWGPLHGKLVKAAQAAGIDVDKIWGLGPNRDQQGNPIPPALAPNLLGMTESCSAHSGMPFNVPNPADKPFSCARPIDGMERRLVDPETGKEVGPGEVGELQIRGPALMKGFYKVDPTKTFTPDGFYPTGDLVRIDEDDYLFYVSRMGDMLKTNGANVSRLEVEGAINVLPGVDVSVVVGLKDEEIGQRIVAAVVAEPGAQLSEQAIKDELNKSLSSFKVPKHVIFITSEDIIWTGKDVAAGQKIKRVAMEPMIAERVGMKIPVAA